MDTGRYVRDSLILQVQRKFLRDKQEGEENLITLAEDDPSVVNEMLRFMYTFDYGTEIVSGSGPEGQAPMLTDVAVHIIADKYDIEPLADLAASKFYQRAATEWCTEGFASAAALVYTAAADREHELRNATMAVATRHAHSLRTEEAGTHFREVMGAVPALALALWEKQVDAHVDSKAATDTLLDAVARFRDDLDAAEAELTKKANVKKYKCPNPTCAWRVCADNVIESVATWSCLVCGQPHGKHFWLANVV